MANVDHKSLGKFHRVQTSATQGKSGTFVTRDSGSGKVTVTLSRDSYASAKKAAASVLKGQGKRKP